MSDDLTYEIKPALCLDFDGTIRHTYHGDFLEDSEEIKLFPGVDEAIWAYRDRGFLIIGISNQGGVAFGYKSAKSVEKEFKATQEKFAKNPFHTVKYSLSHRRGNVEPYRHRSLLRKPDIGMLALCEVEFFERGIIIDWDQSIFVGDREDDRRCAEKAKIKFVHADEFFGRNTND